MSGCRSFPRIVLEIPQSALESRLEKDALVAVRHPARPGAGVREGAWPLPGSVTTACLQLGVGFLSEQFYHYFRL